MTSRSRSALLRLSALSAFAAAGAVSAAACGDDTSDDAPLGGSEQGGGGAAADGGAGGAGAQGGVGGLGGGNEAGSGEGGAGGAAQPDTASPALVVVGLTDGAHLRTARIRFDVEASDDVELARIGYVLNGGAEVEVPLDPSTTEITQAFDLRPTRGANSLLIFAEDAAGNRTEASLGATYAHYVSAGGSHSGVIANGQLYAWGRNNLTQLGLGAGDTTSRFTPVVVPGLQEPVAVELRQNQSMALQQDGTLLVWGNNADGRLGLGSSTTPDTTTRPSPTPIVGLNGVLQATFGYDHALVLLEDGTVVTFGDNSAGQLGDGALEDRSYPSAIASLTDIVQVVGGSKHSLALGRDGTVWAWGRNSYGNLGQGAADDDAHPTPVTIAGLTDIVQLASGRDHVLALRADGALFGWGLNNNGQVGVGTSGDDTDVFAPEEITLPGAAVAIVGDGNYSFAVLDDGSAVGWGSNFNGQLGLGGDDTADRIEPSDPLVLTNVDQVDLGATHAVGRTNAGAFYTWGWSTNGSLGRADLLNNWAYTTPGLVVLP